MIRDGTEEHDLVCIGSEYARLLTEDIHVGYHISPTLFLFQDLKKVNTKEKKGKKRV